MADRSQEPILIAGAGIAGLTAAILLARAGFRVALIERATGFAEIGAGLQLSPNASRILIALGLGPALSRRAAKPERLTVRRLGRDRAIARMPLNQDNPFGAPFWTTLRRDLQTALVDAVRSESAVTLLVGRAALRVEEDGAGVTLLVETSSGARETIRGAALIGADGLWSQIVATDEAPVFAGFEAWRALVPAADAPAPARAAEVSLWLGRGAHVVHYPVAAGAFVNLVLTRSAAAPRGARGRDAWDLEGDARALVEMKNAAATPLRDLIAAASDWKVWSLFDRPRPRPYAAGRVALIGDAAHPVLPLLAQGAALAIEDAAILAQEAARSPADLAAAFARYAERRAPRAARVQKASRANARAYHAGGLVALGRDMVMARLGEKGMLERYRWLYGWTPDS